MVNAGVTCDPNRGGDLVYPALKTFRLSDMKEGEDTGTICNISSWCRTRYTASFVYPLTILTL
jgi:hypothetical protein